MTSVVSAKVEARLFVSGNADANVLACTRQTLEEELDWLFSFTVTSSEIFSVTIVEASFNDILFAPQRLLEVTLLFSWQDHTMEQRVALLVEPNERWEQKYRESLAGIVRYDLDTLGLFPSQAALLDYASPAGLFSVDASADMIVGRRFWVTDYDHKPLALVEVEDRFASGQNDSVAEFFPLWSKQPLSEGMLVEATAPQHTISTAVLLALNLAGGEIGVSFPLPSTMFRFSVKTQAGYNFLDDTKMASVLAGASIGTTIGALAQSSQMLLRNMGIAVAAHLGFGVGDQMQFFYGADLQLILSWQPRPRFFWGISVGYHHWASFSPEDVPTFPPGTTLSPYLGWLW